MKKTKTLNQKDVSKLLTGSVYLQWPTETEIWGSFYATSLVFIFDLLLTWFLYAAAPFILLPGAREREVNTRHLLKEVNTRQVKHHSEEKWEKQRDKDKKRKSERQREMEPKMDMHGGRRQEAANDAAAGVSAACQWGWPQHTNGSNTEMTHQSTSRQQEMGEGSIAVSHGGNVLDDKSP